MFLLLLVTFVFALGLYHTFFQSSPFNLDNKVFLITGAGSGIGHQIASNIWKRATNATLVLLDVNHAALSELKHQLEGEQQMKSTNKVFIHRCDVSNQNEVDECISTVEREILPSHISVLVNNAGIVHGKRFFDLTPAEIEHIFKVNVFSHFWMVKRSLSSMKMSTDACIVSISSVMGMLSSVRLVDYCASKSAVNGFHDSLRLELRKQGIHHINTLLVCPMAIDTGMFDGILEKNTWINRISCFIAPVLKVDDVAEEIISGIISRKKLLISCSRGWRGFVLPWLPALARLLPVTLYDFCVSLAGGTHGMDSFRGKKNKHL